MSKESKETRNSYYWKIIFEQEKILKKIKTDVFFEISSKKINKQREARLMTKFDYQVQLPDIFKENNLSIQPISRGRYVIGNFESYYTLPESSPVSIGYPKLPSHIRTLSHIGSESSAILFALHSGMIADLLGEEVLFTVFGRMSTGSFK